MSPLFVLRLFVDQDGRRRFAVCDVRTGEALVICHTYRAAAGLLQEIA